MFSCNNFFTCLPRVHLRYIYFSTRKVIIIILLKIILCNEGTKSLRENKSQVVFLLNKESQTDLHHLNLKSFTEFNLLVILQHLQIARNVIEGISYEMIGMGRRVVAHETRGRVRGV